jgi:ankyrin repeat protein
MKGHKAVVTKLLAQDDVDPDSKDKDGAATALSWAAQNRHEAVVTKLLARDDVDPDSKDKNGWTPLLLAAGTGHVGVVTMLPERDG